MDYNILFIKAVFNNKTGYKVYYNTLGGAENEKL